MQKNHLRCADDAIGRIHGRVDPVLAFVPRPHRAGLQGLFRVIRPPAGVCFDGLEIVVDEVAPEIAQAGGWLVLGALGTADLADTVPGVGFVEGVHRAFDELRGTLEFSPDCLLLQVLEYAGGLG